MAHPSVAPSAVYTAQATEKRKDKTDISKWEESKHGNCRTSLQAMLKEKKNRFVIASVDKKHDKQTHTTTLIVTIRNLHLFGKVERPTASNIQCVR